MAQNKGEVRILPVENVTSKTLVSIIKENVTAGSVVMSDEFRSYKKLPKEGYTHLTVNHAIKEYVRTENGISVSTNMAENFWKNLKAGIDAIYIHVSKKHLDKYCDEFSFRYNTRKLTDTERFTLWFGCCNNKRLTYKAIIA